MNLWGVLNDGTNLVDMYWLEDIILRTASMTQSQTFMHIHL